MKSKTGRFVTAFNGEIYNHLDIRKDLEKTYALPKNYWHGTSDTETLLSSIELQGFENTLEVLLGMFSFAVWDNLENTLSLARDRVGEKPLYFSFLDKNLYFFISLAMLSWAVAWTSAKIVNEYLSYDNLVFLRFVIGNSNTSAHKHSR